jgi:hypothetical protein
MFLSACKLLLCIFVTVVRVSSNFTVSFDHIDTQNASASNRARVQSVPRAIVHIGPHKTSSSHIQLFLATHTALLETENVFWPCEQSGKPFTAKETALLALALRDPSNDHYRTIDTVKYFLRESLARNRSVVLSSEELDPGSVQNFRLLADMLTGFDVTVVYVYRELLSHMVSLYFEMNRFEHDSVRFSGPFSTYLLSNLDHVSAILDPGTLLRDYSEVFGRDSIQIIDLAGCAAGDHDVTYVLVCEVAGVLCDRPELFQDRGLGSNAAYSLVPAEVFSFHNAYVQLQHNGTCRHCGRLRDAYNHFADTLRADISHGVLPPVPTVRSNLGMLVPFAQQVDATLRAQYGDRILHGNASAALWDMQHRAHIESLHVPDFVSSRVWAQWMQGMFERSLKEGRICGCKE